MSQSTDKTPAAGGFLIAVGAIGGTAVGLALGQPSAGFLVGAAIGIIGAIAIWLLGRQG